MRSYVEHEGPETGPFVLPRSGRVAQEAARSIGPDEVALPLEAVERRFHRRPGLPDVPTEPKYLRLVEQGFGVEVQCVGPLCQENSVPRNTLRLGGRVPPSEDLRTDGAQQELSPDVVSCGMRICNEGPSFCLVEPVLQVDRLGELGRPRRENCLLVHPLELLTARAQGPLSSLGVACQKLEVSQDRAAAIGDRHPIAELVVDPARLAEEIAPLVEVAPERVQPGQPDEQMRFPPRSETSPNNLSQCPIASRTGVGP